MIAAACHCRGCQKMTGSAFSLSSLYPLDRFEVIDGEAVRGGLGEGMAYHHMCPACLSWTYTTFDGGPPFVNIRSTLLDDPAGDPPFIDNYVSEKLEYAQTGAPHGYEKFMSEADFEQRLAEYAAWRERG